MSRVRCVNMSFVCAVWGIIYEQNISLDQLQDGFLDEILAPWLPTTSTNNYRIALRKYQHYQRQTCTGLVQKSSSLPASDIY